MALPESFVALYAPFTKGATMFGQPMEDLSREELLAVIGMFHKQVENLRESHASLASLLTTIGGK